MWIVARLLGDCAFFELSKVAKREGRRRAKATNGAGASAIETKDETVAP